MQQLTAYNYCKQSRSDPADPSCIYSLVTTGLLAHRATSAWKRPLYSRVLQIHTARVRNAATTQSVPERVTRRGDHACCADLRYQIYLIYTENHEQFSVHRTESVYESIIMRKRKTSPSTNELWPGRPATTSHRNVAALADAGQCRPVATARLPVSGLRVSGDSAPPSRGSTRGSTGRSGRDHSAPRKSIGSHQQRVPPPATAPDPHLRPRLRPRHHHHHHPPIPPTARAQ